MSAPAILFSIYLIIGLVMMVISMATAGEKRELKAVSPLESVMDSMLYC